MVSPPLWTALGGRTSAALWHDNGTAAPLVPARPTLTKLREAAAGCTACPLYETGTQTVFGEGLAEARRRLRRRAARRQEDQQGQPFVGPAGKLLDRALAEAGIDRAQVYVTNAVKHFKWQARGKRRIHEKPNWAEIAACRPWLDAELAVLEPRVLVCLGATAAQALLGRDFRVTQKRGQLVESVARRRDRDGAPVLDPARGRRDAPPRVPRVRRRPREGRRADLERGPGRSRPARPRYRAR